MKGLKENKGFTLIELLAVIVVLAIIMVLAVTTVLPYMGEARKSAFATEAEAAKAASANAMSLIMLGNKLTEGEDYEKTTTTENDVTTTTYCFKIEQLVNAGLLDTEPNKYEGIVKASTSNNKAYTYEVHMTDNTSYVLVNNAEVKAEHVIDTEPDDFLKACN